LHRPPASSPLDFNIMAVWQQSLKQNMMGGAGGGFGYKGKAGAASGKGVFGGKGFGAPKGAAWGAPAAGDGGDAPYKVKLCNFWMQGTCTKGAGCTYAHGEHELGGSGGGGGFGAPAKGGMMGGKMGGKRGGKMGGKMGGKDDMMKGMMGMMMDMMGGGMKGKGKGKGKDKGKSKNKGQGHTLPRERITETPVIGEVLEWKGKYGWVQPSEPIEHEKAAKREGKIFVSQADLSGVTELTPGKLVQFHVFSDPSGLGAEEVLQA